MVLDFNQKIVLLDRVISIWISSKDKERKKEMFKKIQDILSTIL